MPDNLRVALAQLNCLVGDISGNADKIIEAARRAVTEMRAHLVVFPELAVTGYPPEDLLLRQEFSARVAEEMQRLAAELPDIVAIVGHPHRRGKSIFNAVSAIGGGRIITTYHKQLLPNYSVFDEKRYFTAGSAPCTLDLRGVRLGLTICEDIWEPGPMAQAAAAGAQLMININASPYHIDKLSERKTVVGARATDNELPVIYLNMVGGQDELVFDGGSFVMDKSGTLTQLAPEFEEGIYLAEFECPGAGVKPVPGAIGQPSCKEQSVYSALVTGVRDYVHKNGFNGAIIGLSGGIDSALTLAIAADALGADRVEAVMMPSPYTAAMSLEDARAQAEALNARYTEIPIQPIVERVEAGLAPMFAGTQRDATEENIQARVRGVLLMALSNKKGMIVLTTGNKSEMAVGYATLYGDMVGGFAVIKDVPKLLVYRLADYRNSIAPIIPQRVIDRPPSAELRPNQKDADSLPPYSVLDAIIEMYVEEDKSAQEILDLTGHDPQMVLQVIAMVNRNEYKRRQAAPGVRISHRAFGRDRRYPITSGFKQRPPLPGHAPGAAASGS